MSTNKINVVINGSELNIENPNADQLAAIISALSAPKPSAAKEQSVDRGAVTNSVAKKPVKNTKAVKRKGIASKLSNRQFEKTSLSISDLFGVDNNNAFYAAKTHKLVLMSKETALPLSTPSKQTEGRIAIIKHFVDSDNASVRFDDVLSAVLSNGQAQDATRAAIYTYLGDLALFGVIAKTGTGKGVRYHLSAWFLGQLEGLT